MAELQTQKKKYVVLPGLIMIEGPEAAGKSSLEAEMRILAPELWVTNEPTIKPPRGAGPSWFEEDRREHVVKMRESAEKGARPVTFRYQPSTMVNQKSNWPEDIPFPELSLFLIPELRTLQERAAARVASGDQDPMHTPEMCLEQWTRYRKVAQWMGRQNTGAVVIFVPSADTTPRRTAEVFLEFIRASPIEREALRIFWSGHGPEFGMKS